MNPSDPTPQPDLEHAWERRLHAELRQLPELDAPASLLTDVMAQVRAREALWAKAWWRRPATTWHPVLRVSFGALALAVFAGLMLGAHLLWPELVASSGAQTVSTFTAKLHAVWDAARTLYDGLYVAASALLTPTRLAIVAVIILSQVLLLSAGGAALRASLVPRRAA